MNNFMKTIINAVQTWTKGKIKESTADWDENDSNSNSYIKNKPFYEEKVLNKTFDENVFCYPNPYECGNDDSPITLSLDVTYKVVWNGVVYECVPYEFNGTIAIGSLLILGAPEEYGGGNNEPFIIGGSQEIPFITILSKENHTIHTFSLYSVVDGVETAILENEEANYEGCLAWSDSYYDEDFPHISEEGKKYVVTFDGETFECISKHYDEGDGCGWYYIGNDIWSENTGEPLYIESYYWTNDDGTISYESYIGSKYTGNHKITILGYETVVHKLDEKYLPNAYATVEEVQTVQVIADTANANAFNAQTTADTAITNASTAQATAGTAQATADLAKTTADSKMNATNPVGTGSFSLNRQNDSRVGEFSTAIGESTIANTKHSFARGKFNTQIPIEYFDEWISEGKAFSKTQKIYSSSSYSFNEEIGCFELTGEISEYSVVNLSLITFVTLYFMIDTVSGTEIGRAAKGKTITTKLDRTTGLYNFTTLEWNRSITAKYVEVVGNGTSDTDRSNAHTLDWEGNAWYQGDVYVGGEDQDNGAKKLATEEYVTNSLANLEVPTKISAFENDSGFITNAVTDLTNYYLKSETYTQDEINALVSAIPKFSIEVVASLPTTDISTTTVYLVKNSEETGNLYDEYIYVNSKWEHLGSQSVDLSGYALKNEIPTKLSEFENDSAYLTSIPSEYITETELNSKGYLTEHQDLSAYAKTSAIPTKTSELTNDSGFITSKNLDGYATEAFVANKIAEAELAGDDVDLSGYATKDDIKDFITEVPSEYITETELNAKGYLTQHQDLSDYAKTDDVPTKLSELTEDSTHRVVTDTEKTTWNAKSNFSGSYNDLTDKPTIPTVPVTSVNGKTGDISLSAGDVGALPSTYTPPDQTAAQVGADPKGTAESKVSTHNTSDTSHNDIRLLIEDLTTRLNTLANSTDADLDQLSEVVAYIKANRTLIESITTSKVSVSDIVNNLTTNVSNRPLSAAQGVALKALIDAIKVPTKLSELSEDSTHRVVTDTEKAAWNAKSEFSGKYADLTGKPTIPTKTSQLTNDSGFLTQHQSLSGYAKTADHYTKTESDNKYQAKGNYLTSVPSEYVTETELTNKKYLTAVPSEYVTETELNSKGYVKNTELDSAIDDALTEAKESGEFDEVYIGSSTAPEGTKVQINPEAEGRLTIPDVLQTAGSSTEDTMSQKAITDLVNNAGYVKDTELNSALDSRADITEGAFYIEGSGTTDATAKTSTWVGTSDRITEYYDGLTIRYKIGVDGQSTVTLNINNLGAKTVYRFNTTKLTTQFPVGSIIHLIYHADLNDGCWVTNDYDANTNTQQRVYVTTTNKEYPITARYNTTTGATYYAEYGRYSDGVTLNPSTNTITATAFKGKLTGNADTATKATQDASGNNIASTYAKKSEAETWTFTLADGSTVTKKVVLG